MKGVVEDPINGQKSPSACARARESLPQWGKGSRQPGCYGCPETRFRFAPIRPRFGMLKHAESWLKGGKRDSPRRSLEGFLRKPSHFVFMFMFFSFCFTHTINKVKKN